MAKKFEPEYLTMNDIFKRENIYNIPINQRKYSWNELQYEEYWNDIIATINDENKLHYLGVITLVRKDEKNIRPQNYEVVDGQQRLITTVLFIAALRDVYLGLKNIDKAKEIHDTYLTGKTPRISYKKIVSSKIDECTINCLVNVQNLTLDEVEIDINNFSSGRLKDLDPSEFQNKNMLGAYEFFFKGIISEFENNGHDVEHLIKIEELLLKIEVITVVSDDISNIFLYFNSLNNRGLQLNQMDIIRNKFFNIVKDKYENEIEYYGSKWDDLVMTLDECDCVKFLKYFYMCEQGNIISSKDLPLKYDELFKAKNTSVEMDKLINKIIEYSEIYKKLFSKQQENNSESYYIKEINYLGQQACHSFLMDYFYYVDDEERRICILNDILKMNYRRIICNSSTKQLDGIFKELILSKKDNNDVYDDNRIKDIILKNTPNDSCLITDLKNRIWDKDNISMYTLYLLNENQINFDDLLCKGNYFILFVPADSKVSRDIHSFVLAESKFLKENYSLEYIAKNTKIEFTKNIIENHNNKKEELTNIIVNDIISKASITRL